MVLEIPWVTPNGNLAMNLLTNTVEIMTPNSGIEIDTSVCIPA